MKLEINYRQRDKDKKKKKKKITWRLNNTLLKNQWVSEKIKKEILKYLETNNNENLTIQNLGLLSCSVMSNSLWLYGLQPTRLLSPWDFPGKNTGVGCHVLLQGIFPTQGLNLHLLCLLHCMQIHYHCMGLPLWLRW